MTKHSTRGVDDILNAAARPEIRVPALTIPSASTPLPIQPLLLKGGYF